MTTFRRFCCNDLFRLGRTNLPKIRTPNINNYMCYMTRWPANCHVAYMPGGLITGYRNGYKVYWMDVTVFFVYPDELSVLKKLVELLESSCDQIYSACTMKIIILANNTNVIKRCHMLGFSMISFRQENRGDSLVDIIEMRKPLQRLVARRNQSRIQSD